MALNLNHVVVSGNLTKDPELRQLAGGMSVCKLRIAVNDSVKDKDTGQWEDRPNYFDVSVWGKMGENVAKYLQKGSPLLIEGSLRWREWKAEDGTGRQAVEINAMKAIFMGGKGEGGGDTGAGGGGKFGDPAADDDDIPF